MAPAGDEPVDEYLETDKQHGEGNVTGSGLPCRCEGGSVLSRAVKSPRHRQAGQLKGHSHDSSDEGYVRGQRRDDGAGPRCLATSGSVAAPFAETGVLFAEWPLSSAFAKSYKVGKWPMYQRLD